MVQPSSSLLPGSYRPPARGYASGPPAAEYAENKKGPRQQARKPAAGGFLLIESV